MEPQNPQRQNRSPVTVGPALQSRVAIATPAALLLARQVKSLATARLVVSSAR